MKSTNLKKVFEDSQETLNQFLITQLPINIFLINTEGYVCWANKNLLDFVSMDTVDDVIGMHISEWDKCRWHAIEEVLKSQQETITEEFYNGTFFSTVRKPVIQNGELIGVLGLSIDITEKKQSEIAKQEFLMNMAHDLRTPLMGIMGLANLQANQQMDQQDQQQYGQWIHGASVQLLELLNSAITVKTSELQIECVKNEKIDLLQLAHELQILMKPSLESKGLSFQLQLKNGLPVVISDRIKLKRLLLNLLSNALKFTKQGTITLKIRVLTIKNGKAAIKISVIDTGIGISKDKLEKIFDRFYRVHPSYLAEYTGYGLGLYLVKKATELLGGKINVASEEGKGSCFSLDFKFSLAEPCSDMKSPVDSAPTFVPQVIADKLKGSVLVAEDNTLVLYVVKKMLAGLGYQVTTASTGEEALQALKMQPFDWGILDIGLPGLDGIEVTKQYREWEQLNNDSRLPIFALTAHAEDKVKSHCQQIGFDFVLHKPFTEKDMNIIQKFLK
ncbi:ATP-binding protein [Rickettsiella endosymbiont of Aleochara curtula]|uniref:ATP-binding protein n=1 Tax=Rickettsiella endosymbiont of Aleochara curtula TaxID=3077936 RepID=UPI00313C6B96